MAWLTFQPKDNFNCTTYTGTGAANTITGVGFQPDFIWQKARSQSQSHRVFDSVRGGTSLIYPDLANGEDTSDQFITSFNSDGFTMGTAGGNANDNGTTYVSWNWKTGTTSGLSGGTITPSSYSINATTGVGIYKYTGTGSAGTIPHGLGVAPKLVIIKRTNANGQWSVYHYEVGEAKHLALDTKIAEQTGSAYWNDTAPTSTVFSLGNGTDVNTSGGTYIAYVYAEKRGFSRIGKYIGNNDTDGAFVFTGFKPGFLITKSISSGDTQWMMRDKKRGFNGAIKTLYADSSEQETSADSVELLSNGFVFRDTSSAHNAAAGYAFWAFAEEPLVASNKDVVTAG